jgi:hypothetical protein
MGRGEQPLFSTPGDETGAGQMVKKLTSFIPGESETDAVVRRWLDRHGIDQKLVAGYSIFRHQGEVPRIALEMYFDDAPAADDAGETLTGAPIYTGYELRAQHVQGRHADQPNLSCPLCSKETLPTEENKKEG